MNTYKEYEIKFILAIMILNKQLIIFYLIPTAFTKGLFYQLAESLAVGE